METYDGEFLGVGYSLLWRKNEIVANYSRDLITIWSPTYNHQDFLEDYFRGINQQVTAHNVEVVIIDDASNRNSFEKLTQLASECKFPIKIIKLHRNHHCQSSKWLLASRFANGEYIAFCDPSDFWTNPNKLEIQLNEMRSTGSSWSITRAKRYNIISSETAIMLKNVTRDCDKKYLSSALLNLAWGDVPFCTMVIQKSVFLRVMRYLETNPAARAMDHIYMMAAVAEGDCAFIDENTANYRVGIESSFTGNYIFDERKRLEFFESHSQSLSQFLVYLGSDQVFPPTIKYISWMVGQYFPILYERELTSVVNSLIKTNFIECQATHYLVFGSGFYGKILTKNEIFLEKNVVTVEGDDLKTTALFKQCVKLQSGGEKIAIYVSIFDPSPDLMDLVRSYFYNLGDVKIYNFPEELLLQLAQKKALSFMKKIVTHIPLCPDMKIPTTASLI